MHKGNRVKAATLVCLHLSKKLHLSTLGLVNPVFSCHSEWAQAWHLEDVNNAHLWFLPLEEGKGVKYLSINKSFHDVNLSDLIILQYGFTFFFLLVSTNHCNDHIWCNLNISSALGKGGVCLLLDLPWSVRLSQQARSLPAPQKAEIANRPRLGHMGPVAVWVWPTLCFKIHRFPF